jgi:MoxR-like ATPase
MLPREDRDGPNGVLFLDELNAAPPAMSAAAYQLVLDRKLGDYELPAGWVVFAAGKRETDRGVTSTMPTPLANRFAHFEFEVSVKDWTTWATRSSSAWSKTASTSTWTGCCEP